MKKQQPTCQHGLCRWDGIGVWDDGQAGPCMGQCMAWCMGGGDVDDVVIIFTI